VTPHEALMALKPTLFPWECKIITDFNKLLYRKDMSEPLPDIFAHEYTADE